MFNTMQNIVAGLTTGMSKPKPPRVDPLVEGMSTVIQEHESAASRLKHVMGKVFDGDKCHRITIATAPKQ